MLDSKIYDKIKFQVFTNLHSTDVMGICGITFILILLTYLHHKLFREIYTLKMDCLEIGFEKAGRPGFDGVRKRAIVNELRKRKKNGRYPNPFPNGWFAILESNQLVKQESIEINVLGLNLVAWRGQSGVVYVADAYCPHLGAHLGVSSRVLGDCIECPFHSWCFDGKENGKLVNVPYSKKVPGKVNLRMKDSYEVDGVIYLWHHLEGKQPTWFPEAEPGIKSHGWKCRAVLQIQMGGLVQDLNENDSDLAHFNELHTDFSFLSGDMKNWRRLRPYLRHMHDMKWEAGSGHVARCIAKQWLQLFGRFTAMHTDFQLVFQGPGIVHHTISTSTGVFRVVQTQTPRDSKTIDYTARIYSSLWVPRPIIKSLTNMMANQISRDIRVINRKIYLENPRLLSEDSAILRFRRWHNQFYSPNVGKTNKESTLEF